MKKLTPGSITLALMLVSPLGIAKSPPDPPPCGGPANQTISTDAPGHLDKDCVRISKSQKHGIVWKPQAGHGKLESLLFDSTNEPENRPPFASCARMPCTITCDSNGSCQSGAINPELQPPPGGYRYGYTVSWAPKKVGADPSVMIDP